MIHVGAYWDGEAHELKHDADIVVEGGKVKEIRPHRGKADVDSSGLTAIPGLIDAHNHWHLRGRQWGARRVTPGWRTASRPSVHPATRSTR